MHIQARKQSITMQHKVASIVIKPVGKVRIIQLRRLINDALDCYAEFEHIPADVIHEQTKNRLGKNYDTTGYHLRLYRHRMGLTQKNLAAKADLHQHHISEMEHNRRPIGKTVAKRLGSILNCDYRKLL